MTVIGRFDRPDGRYYVDPLDPDRVYLSNTSILSDTTGLGFLQDWAAKLAAEFAVDELELVAATKASSAGRTGAVDLVKGAAKRSRERKADVGSYVHDVVEALIVDRPIPNIPEWLNGRTVGYDGEDVTITQQWLDSIIDGFINFCEDFEPEFEMAEATVVSRANGHAGTLDFIAVLRRLIIAARAARILGDAKTGAALDKTIHEQLAGYLFSDEVWLDDIGSVAPMPAVDLAAVLHLRTSYTRGYKLLEAEIDQDTYPRFLGRVQQIRQVREAARVTGRPLYPSRPDGSQPPPLVEDVDVPGFNLYRGKLVAAGIADLEQLAQVGYAGVQRIKGLGPKAPDACAKALAKHGLHFPDFGPAVLLDALRASRADGQFDGASPDAPVLAGVGA
jgi:hypothetical protein